MARFPVPVALRTSTSDLVPRENENDTQSSSERPTHELTKRGRRRKPGSATVFACVRCGGAHTRNGATRVRSVTQPSKPAPGGPASRTATAATQTVFRTVGGMDDDLYTRLGVAPSAPVEVISAAYKALLKHHHPDLAADETDRVRRETVSKSLGEAHAVLTDAAARKIYDEQLGNDKLSNGKTSTPGADAGTGSADWRTQTSATASEIFEEYERITRSQQRQNPDAAAKGLVSPNGEVVSGYDELQFLSRRRLLLFAVADQEWRRFRRALLKDRPRIGGIPAGWFTTDPTSAPDTAPRSTSLRLRVGASWKHSSIAAGVWCVLTFAAALLWSGSWYENFARERVGTVWFVPVIVVPVPTLFAAMIPSAVLLLFWLRRYGGWFAKVPGARLRLGVYTTFVAIALMTAPLLVTPVAAALTTAAMLGAVALRG